MADDLAALRKMFAAAISEKVGPAKPAVPNEKLDRWLAQADVVVDYSDLRPGQWLPDDVSYGSGPVRAGTARVFQGKVTIESHTAAVYDHFWDRLKLAPGSRRTHGALGRTDRAGFTIRSPSFVVDKANIFYLVRGGGTAYAAVAGHSVIQGPLHGRIVRPFADEDHYRWVRHEVGQYRGLPVHVELTPDLNTNFAIAAIVQSDELPPANPNGLTSPNGFDPSAFADTVAEYQAKELELADEAVWMSRLAPALLDGTGVDESVFVRGNPSTPGDVVPHRSLEALAGPGPLEHRVGSGRYELAVQLTDPDRNPYVSRVMVNRIWHHLFGRGIVASTDNFGVLGERPTHPELLDYLATEFVADGWSLKRMVRRLVLSSTYRMSSDGPTPEADAENLLLHKFRVRRLEGESIRDAILAVSGRLDSSIGGPPVPIHLDDFLQGRGRPKSGPLDGNGRRSMYLAVRRNFLSPFLIAFDTPTPFSTVGRRQVSNVPAQALVLMNDPFVHEQAKLWAGRIADDPRPVGERITSVYLSAFGRPPTDKEVAICREFISGQPNDVQTWTDLTHAMFNVKEFVFLN